MKKSGLIFFALAGFFLTNGAFAKKCELTIEGNDAKQFSKKELQVEASCKKVTLTLKHTGQLPKAAMGHNWILTKFTNTKDAMKLTGAAMKAGLKGNYIPKDPNVIAGTKVIGGGETTTLDIDFSKLKPGKFVYFCSFPGRGAIMNGILTFKRR